MGWWCKWLAKICFFFFSLVWLPHHHHHHHHQSPPSSITIIINHHHHHHSFFTPPPQQPQLYVRHHRGIWSWPMELQCHGASTITSTTTSHQQYHNTYVEKLPYTVTSRITTHLGTGCYNYEMWVWKRECMWVCDSSSTLIYIHNTYLLFHRSPSAGRNPRSWHQHLSTVHLALPGNPPPLLLLLLSSSRVILLLLEQTLPQRVGCRLAALRGGFVWGGGGAYEPRATCICSSSTGACITALILHTCISR